MYVPMQNVKYVEMWPRHSSKQYGGPEKIMFCLFKGALFGVNKQSTY